MKTLKFSSCPLITFLLVPLFLKNRHSTVARINFYDCNIITFIDTNFPPKDRANPELSLDVKIDSVFWESNEDIGIVFY